MHPAPASVSILDEDPSPTQEALVSDTSQAPAHDVRSSPVARQMRWLVDLVRSGPAADDDAKADGDAESRFMPAFLERHESGLAPLLDSWRALGPFGVESETPVAHKGWTTLVGPGGSRYTLAMTVDSSGLIRRADIEPEVLRGVPRDFADVDEALTRPDVTSTALVSRWSGERWVDLYDRSADDVMPTGSVYKVYVLLALARAVREGRAHWDDEITLRPQERSLPTGEMQDLPDGATETVYRTAYNMFVRSDNTASDMVLHHLGRDAVHQAVADAGHHDPRLLRPFPSSRELFEVGWGRDGLLAEWERADGPQREELLRRIDGPLTARLPDLTHTAHDRGLDWFLTARDVSSALAALLRETTLDPTGRLRTIVSTYAGVDIDRDRWPVSLFKGGSTPGVVVFCWLLVDPDGVDHVIVLMQRAERVGVLRDGLPLRRLGDMIMNSLIP